jgi:hypothetical protein
MKILIIIIAVITLFFLVKISKSVKEKTKNSNNMILCKMCGYHVPYQDLCDTKKDVDECPNKNER